MTKTELLDGEPAPPSTVVAPVGVTVIVRSIVIVAVETEILHCPWPEPPLFPELPELFEGFPEPPLFPALPELLDGVPEPPFPALLPDPLPPLLPFEPFPEPLTGVSLESS